MPNRRPEIEDVNIVFLGDFTPSIFQPAWFALHDILSMKETETANIDVVHPEILSVSFESFKLQVQRERFTVSTSNPAGYEIMRDLSVSSFRILRDTPIRVMGINHTTHTRVQSENEWHKIGHRLAPKELWSNILDAPGMRSLTMEGKRPDDCVGYIRVRVEPSQRVHPGVFVSVNDHYAIEDHKPEQGCDAIIDILEQHWQESWNRSNHIASSVLEEALDG